MATTDTNVPQVIVNKLTKAQYAAATKNPTEFYAVTDADPVEAGYGLILSGDTMSADTTVLATKTDINGKVISGAGAPTTATVGTVGLIYEDTTNGKLYICTAVSGSTYTWEEISMGGGDGIKELTSSDYNYPANNPQYIATWLLPQGVYTVSDMDIRGRVVSDADGEGYGFTEVSAFIVTDLAGTGVKEVCTLNGSPAAYLKGYTVVSSDGSLVELDEAVWTSQIVDSLNYTSSTVPLSANQGKVLNEKIEGRVIQNTGVPTTATVGTVGLLYEDTTNGKLYICTAVTGDGGDPEVFTYTWEEVGGTAVATISSQDWNGLWQ